MTGIDASKLMPVCLLLLALAGTSALPDGAPSYACKSPVNMVPAHSHAAPLSAKDSDYKLIQDKAAFKANDVVTVQLLTKGLPFKGFLVKAVDEHGKDVGQFLPGDLYHKVEECPAATHVDRSDKTLVTMRWQAPADHSGQVHFV
ncbi:hypothetical protein HPB48_010088 [Haemaphysalis longicornis]|uniref:Reelin domain-containing protein n=1 Tax=Haemaphysalis longicornis TaxID=44386 RepID=A0A9J6FXG3_HAELO|nr:hypothetical protein HPB48_010088 [Haemaphysalis longicornis]